MEDYWFILNKIGSGKVESLIMDKLGSLKERVIGSVPFDQELIEAGLSGKALGECRALEDVTAIVDQLEQQVSHQSESR